ncbi:MAG: DNA replication/repair protein RecF [Acidimicrobiia bacterium]
MALTWISLTDFRSYADLHWSPDPGTNILVGDNGAGKTNLLEAVGYLAMMRSFRNAPDEALVRDEASSGVIRGETNVGTSNTLIEIEIKKRGGRRARLGGKPLPRVTDLLGALRVVSFLPEDLDLVKGAPAGRRALLDDLAVQLWPAAHQDQAEYDRALRQRNAYLKSGDRDSTTIEVWDSRLSQAGARVMSRRARAAAALLGATAEIYSTVADRPSDVTISYQSDWGGSLDPSTPPSEWTAALTRALEARRRADYELKLTSAGPHRDDPTLVLDQRQARHQASQGEQRTLALGLRIASHRAIVENVETDPVLLLDDVFSELDPHRSEAMIAALPAAQTLITTTRPEEVPVEGKVWRVEPGIIE